jgi:MFS family permease
VSATVIRKVSVAVAVSSVVALPVPLVGGLAVLLQEDLGFGDAQLGTAIAAYFASGALASPLVGRLAERLGPRTTVWLGLACALGSLLGIALVARSWASLVVFLALGGIGNTVGQLGANMIVVRGVVAHRQGVAFGVKQAAVPLAALFAGLSVPAIGLTFGWRWAFILGALIAPLVAAAVPINDARPSGDGRSRQRDTPVDALILLAIGVALAAAGGDSSAAFVVVYLVDRGFSPADAGLALAAGSFVGLAVRVLAGWLGDRLGRGSLLLAAIFTAVGAVGYVGLAIGGHPALIVLSVTLAFGGGWGWSGLWLLAVSRSNPVAPGTAMGIVHMGGMVGAVVGPLAFGALAEQVAFSASWLLMAAMAMVGIGTMLLSRQRILGARPDLAGRL